MISCALSWSGFRENAARPSQDRQRHDPGPFLRLRAVLARYQPAGLCPDTGLERVPPIREDVFLRIKQIVEGSGTRFAIPSQTLYMTRDGGLDAERAAQADAEVARWRETGTLPFPRLTPARMRELEDTLAYPPEGSSEWAQARARKARRPSRSLRRKPTRLRAATEKHKPPRSKRQSIAVVRDLRSSQRARTVFARRAWAAARACDRHPNRRAGDVSSRMLFSAERRSKPGRRHVAADAELECRRVARRLGRRAHEFRPHRPWSIVGESDTCVPEKPCAHKSRKGGRGVIARNPERRLVRIIRCEGEELPPRQQNPSTHSRARGQFDHGANLVVRSARRSRHQRFGEGLDIAPLHVIELGCDNQQRESSLTGRDRWRRSLAGGDGALENGAGLASRRSGIGHTPDATPRKSRASDWTSCNSGRANDGSSPANNRGSGRVVDLGIACGSGIHAAGGSKQAIVTGKTLIEGEPAG